MARCWKRSGSIALRRGAGARPSRYVRVWKDAVPISIGESGGGDLTVFFAQYNPMSLDAARVRLEQIPAGTRLKWQLNGRHTPEIDAWVAADG